MTALLVVSSIVGTLFDFTPIISSYLYLAALVFTLNHLFVGLESIILDYVHNEMAVTTFLLLLRICSLSIIVISIVLVFLG